MQHFGNFLSGSSVVARLTLAYVRSAKRQDETVIEFGYETLPCGHDRVIVTMTRLGAEAMKYQILSHPEEHEVQQWETSIEMGEAIDELLKQFERDQPKPSARVVIEADIPVDQLELFHKYMGQVPSKVLTAMLLSLIAMAEQAEERKAVTERLKQMIDEGSDPMEALISILKEKYGDVNVASFNIDDFFGSSDDFDWGKPPTDPRNN